MFRRRWLKRPGVDLRANSRAKYTGLVGSQRLQDIWIMKRALAMPIAIVIAGAAIASAILFANYRPFMTRAD
jgi:hypothetical protein